MVDTNSYIAYTVMAKRADGKLMFLVENEKNEVIFPVTVNKDSNTGLACVIKLIKDKLNIDIDRLELEELTNAIIQKQRVPLFVFKYDNEHEQLEKLLPTNSTYEWQVSDNFTDTLQKYEITGVPLFEQENLINK